jgi:hypothetical protein
VGMALAWSQFFVLPPLVLTEWWRNWSQGGIHLGRPWSHSHQGWEAWSSLRCELNIYFIPLLYFQSRTVSVSLMEHAGPSLTWSYVVHYVFLFPLCYISNVNYSIRDNFACNSISYDTFYSNMNLKTGRLFILYDFRTFLLLFYSLIFELCFYILHIFHIQINKDILNRVWWLCEVKHIYKAKEKLGK